MSGLRKALYRYLRPSVTSINGPVFLTLSKAHGLRLALLVITQPTCIIACCASGCRVSVSIDE